MSDKQRQIYQTDGDRYEALISREDHQGNIPRAIDEILRVDGLDVLDLGAGTGRLTLLLAPRAKSIRAFDASAEMLRVCRERLVATGLSNWQVETEDLTELDVVGVSTSTPVTLTFDAIPDLEMSGTVKYVKPLGTDNRGDIVYTVVIDPAQQDKRLRWNMTAVAELAVE